MRKRRTVLAVIGMLTCIFLVPETTSPQSCCVTPTSSPSTSAGSGETSDTVSETRFYETLSGGTFTGQAIQESAGLGQGQNGCYFTGSTVPQNPSISTSAPWTVGTYVSKTGSSSAPANVWGYDYVGFDFQGATQVVQAAIAGKVSLPCSVTIPQDIAIMCDAGTFFVYETDTISATISWVDQANRKYQIVNCRGTPQVCGAPIPGSIN